MTTNLSGRCAPNPPGTEPQHAHCRSEACGCDADARHPVAHPRPATSEGADE